MPRLRATPNFAVDEPHRAWWSYTRDDGTVNYCATSARELTLWIRNTLHLPLIPVWDAALLTALANAMDGMAREQPGQGWERIAVTLRASTVPTPLAVRVAIWLAIYRSRGLRLDAIQILDASVLPRANATIALFPGKPEYEGLFCWNPDTQEAPEAATENVRAVAERSRAGVRLAPGEPEPAPPRPRVPTGDEGLSWKVVVPITVGVGIVALLISRAMKSS